MRKVLVVLLAVALLFNTVIFAEEVSDNVGKDILAAFTADSEFASDAVTIRFSEISRGSILNISANADTGIIYAADDKYRVFIKALDDNIDVNETSMVLNCSKGIDRSLPYRFKAFIYICRQEAVLDSYESVLDRQLFFAGKEVVSLLTEVTVEFLDGKAQFKVRKIGTSTSVIDNGNIDKIKGYNMLLVNRNNTMDRSYYPQNLIYSKPSRGRSAINLRLDKEAVSQLNYMLNAAYNDGVSGMVITSAYRTFDKQTSLFNNKINLLSRKMNRKTAMEEAAKIVAVPGSSEHQTGLAVDICSEKVSITKSFADTVQGKWLADNSWKFGYIVRYPKDKTAVTGISYEPWHVRYVGAVHSEIMKVKNLCLEEYVEYLKSNKMIYFKSRNDENYIIQYLYKPDINASGEAMNLPDTSTWSISNCTRDSYILTIKL